MQYFSSIISMVLLLSKTVSMAIQLVPIRFLVVLSFCLEVFIFPPIRQAPNVRLYRIYKNPK